MPGMDKLADYIATHEANVSAFAARIDVATSTVYRLLRGEIDCSAEMARRIMAATGGQIMPNDLISSDWQPRRRGAG